MKSVRGVILDEPQKNGERDFRLRERDETGRAGQLTGKHRAPFRVCLGWGWGCLRGGGGEGAAICTEGPAGATGVWGVPPACGGTGVAVVLRARTRGAAGSRPAPVGAARCVWG